MAETITGLESGSTDERVAAAAAHWGPRFTSNGTEQADFDRVLGRTRHWDDWCREWGRLAEEYESMARRAEAAGHRRTAMEAWRRAGIAWHWAKFVFVDHPREQRAAHERAVAGYARGIAGLDPPAERVGVPFRGTELPAYLRVPATSERPPVVVMVPGLDSVKEELQATAEYLLARGLAILAVDGPGQGESEYELAIEPEYEAVAAAAVDFLEAHPDVAAERAGMFGVSLGGYYTSRSMAFEPRLVAGVALAGPYRFDLEWGELPALTRAAFRHRSRARSDEDARQRAGRLTLEGVAARISHPLLVVHGGEDHLIPASHAERIVAEAPGAELLLYPDGNHGVTNRAFEARSALADWLADRLSIPT